MQYYSVSFGCDPEFFFSEKGKVVGAEKILPEKGLKRKVTDGIRPPKEDNKIIIDGIQAEINPLPSTCRQTLSGHIGDCIRTLYKEIKDRKDLKCDFSSLVDITPEEMDSLSEKSKEFGCQPSFNSNDTDSKKHKIAIVDPSKYMKRSAGGHIHIAPTGDERFIPEAMRGVFRQPKRLISTFDLIVGNTCVLLDRDDGNIERRKNYGRAGEYRTPEHGGIEYRTLSNFWLRSHPLTSFVMALSRFAVALVANDIDHIFKDRVSRLMVQRAINNNNFDLAMRNFKRIEDLILIATAGTGSAGFPLNKVNMKKFYKLVDKGIDHYFKDDPMDHWVNLPNTPFDGWEKFLTKI